MANGSIHEYDAEYLAELESDLALLEPVIAKFAHENGLDISRKKHSPGVEWGHSPRRFVCVAAGRTRVGERWSVLAIARMRKAEGRFQKVERLREGIRREELTRLVNQLDELLHRGWRIASSWSAGDLEPG